MTVMGGGSSRDEHTAANDAPIGTCPACVAREDGSALCTRGEGCFTERTENRAAATRPGWRELEGEWVRRAERPEWGRDDAEWWYAVCDGWRLPGEDERGRRCSIVHCPNVAVLVRIEEITRWQTGAKYQRRSFRCPDHVYGEQIIEDGKVLRARPRFIKEADSDA